MQELYIPLETRFFFDAKNFLNDIDQMLDKVKKA